MVHWEGGGLLRKLKLIAVSRLSVVRAEGKPLMKNKNNTRPRVDHRRGKEQNMQPSKETLQEQLNW